MSEEVRADYEQLAQIAKMFSQQAAEVERMRSLLATRTDNMRSGGWIGKAADSYFNEMDSLVFPGLQRLQQALETAAQQTNQIGQTFRDAEERGRSLFGKRA